MRDYATLPRLYVEGDLQPGQSLALCKEQSHYLGKVLRARIGDRVRVFNGACGEFLCEIISIQNHTVTLNIGEQIRTPYAGTDIWLLFAPIKRERTRFIVEKAVELGVSHIWPVMTARTNGHVRMDKLRAHIIEAAEQTERLDLPTCHDPSALGQVLEGWDETRALIFADEVGDAPPARAVLSKAQAPCAVIIGPQGGFTCEERTHLRSKPFVTPVSLGPRILRADTAAVSVLSIWQALSGDWDGRG